MCLGNFLWEEDKSVRYRPIRQLFEIIVDVHLHSAARQKWASLVAQSVKNLPAMRETWVGKIPGRREWPPTPVFWPGEFHGLYSPWWSQRALYLGCAGSSLRGAGVSFSLWCEGFSLWCVDLSYCRAWALEPVGFGSCGMWA